jgi:hypothetical protein
MTTFNGGRWSKMVFLEDLYQTLERSSSRLPLAPNFGIGKPQSHDATLGTSIVLSEWKGPSKQERSERKLDLTDSHECAN